MSFVNKVCSLFEFKWIYENILILALFLADNQSIITYS